MKMLRHSLPLDRALAQSADDPYAPLRAEMVDRQLRQRGIVDRAVLSTMNAVPRHEFVSDELRGRAYADVPLPIGEGQSISQPYMVAVMTAALELNSTARVLEIGAGCGYQAAVLAHLAKEVFTVECRPRLAAEATSRLERLNIANAHVHCGDGTFGLTEFAAFDGILVAAGAPNVPAPLLGQLAEGGRLIVPVGGAEHQELRLITRRGGEFREQHLDACRFVPLVGQYGWKGSPAR